MKKVNKKKGFTLAELLVVIAILAILIAIAAPIFGGALDNAEQTVIKANARALKSAGMVKIMTDTNAPAAGAGGWKVTGTVDADGNIAITEITAAASGDSETLPSKPADTYVVVLKPTDLT